MKAYDQIKNISIYYKLLGIRRKEYKERGAFTRAYKVSGLKVYYARFGIFE